MCLLYTGTGEQQLAQWFYFANSYVLQSDMNYFKLELENLLVVKFRLLDIREK